MENRNAINMTDKILHTLRNGKVTTAIDSKLSNESNVIDFRNASKRTKTCGNVNDKEKHKNCIIKTCVNKSEVSDNENTQTPEKNVRRGFHRNSNILQDQPSHSRESPKQSYCERELQKIKDCWSPNIPQNEEFKLLRNGRTLPLTPTSLFKKSTFEQEQTTAASAEKHDSGNSSNTNQQDLAKDMSCRKRLVDDEETESLNFIIRRKKLRSEVTNDELWEGLLQNVRFKRLTPKKDKTDLPKDEENTPVVKKAKEINIENDEIPGCSYSISSKKYDQSRTVSNINSIQSLEFKHLRESISDSHKSYDDVQNFIAETANNSQFEFPVESAERSEFTKLKTRRSLREELDTSWSSPVDFEGRECIDDEFFTISRLKGRGENIRKHTDTISADTKYPFQKCSRENKYESYKRHKENLRRSPRKHKTFNSSILQNEVTHQGQRQYPSKMKIQDTGSSDFSSEIGLSVKHANIEEERDFPNNLSGKDKNTCDEKDLLNKRVVVLRSPDLTTTESESDIRNHKKTVFIKDYSAGENSKAKHVGPSNSKPSKSDHKEMTEISSFCYFPSVVVNSPLKQKTCTLNENDVTANFDEQTRIYENSLPAAVDRRYASEISESLPSDTIFPPGINFLYSSEKEINPVPSTMVKAENGTHVTQLAENIRKDIPKKDGRPLDSLDGTFSEYASDADKLMEETICYDIEEYSLENSTKREQEPSSPCEKKIIWSFGEKSERDKRSRNPDEQLDHVDEENVSICQHTENDGDIDKGTGEMMDAMYYSATNPENDGNDSETSSTSLSIDIKQSHVASTKDTTYITTVSAADSGRPLGNMVSLLNSFVKKQKAKSLLKEIETSGDNSDNDKESNQEKKTMQEYQSENNASSDPVNRIPQTSSDNAMQDYPFENSAFSDQTGGIPEKTSDSTSKKSSSQENVPSMSKDESTRPAIKLRMQTTPDGLTRIVSTDTDLQSTSFDSMSCSDETRTGSSKNASHKLKKRTERRQNKDKMTSWIEKARHDQEQRTCEDKERPSNSSSKRRARSPTDQTKGNQKRSCRRKCTEQPEDLLKNSTVGKHASVLWLSENRRHFYQKYDNCSGQEVNELMMKAWEDLCEKEKLRFYQRADNAMKDEDKHSTIGKIKAASETVDNPGLSRKLVKFISLTPEEQHKELRRWLGFVHEVSPREYAKLIAAFKETMKEQKLHRQSTKSKENNDTQSKQRQSLFKKILDIREKVVDIYHQKREKQMELVKENFDIMTRRLIAGDELDLSRSVRSEDLEEVLMDLKSLENEMKIAVSGTPLKSKSYENVLEQLLEDSIESSPASPMAIELPSADSEYAQQILNEVSNDSFPEVEAYMVEHVLDGEMCDSSISEEVFAELSAFFEQEVAPQQNRHTAVRSPSETLTNWVLADQFKTLSKNSADVQLLVHPKHLLPFLRGRDVFGMNASQAMLPNGPYHTTKVQKTSAKKNNNAIKRVPGVSKYDKYKPSTSGSPMIIHYTRPTKAIRQFQRLHADPRRMLQSNVDYKYSSYSCSGNDAPDMEQRRSSRSSQMIPACIAVDSKQYQPSNALCDLNSPKNQRLLSLTSRGSSTSVYDETLAVGSSSTPSYARFGTSMLPSSSTGQNPDKCVRLPAYPYTHSVIHRKIQNLEGRTVVRFTSTAFDGRRMP